MKKQNRNMKSNVRRQRSMAAVGMAAVAGLLLALDSLSSCTLETSSNGNLDGYWHLESIDTLATGHTGDYSNRRFFWGIEHRLISVSDIDREGRTGYYFRFEQTGDSLFLGKVYKNNWHQDNGENGGDIPVDDVEVLRYYGVNELEEHFAKEALSGSKMVLRSKTLRLKFRRF